LKYDCAAASDFKIPAYVKNQKLQKVNKKKQRVFFTIGKNSNGNNDVTGNGITSKIQ
jgi:hypothetical protein